MDALWEDAALSLQKKQHKDLVEQNAYPKLTRTCFHRFALSRPFFIFRNLDPGALLVEREVVTNIQGNDITVCYHYFLQIPY